jgi:hypothetical protein
MSIKQVADRYMKQASAMDFTKVEAEFEMLMKASQEHILKTQIAPLCMDFAEEVAKQLNDRFVTEKAKFKTVQLVGWSDDPHIFTAIDISCVRPEVLGLEHLHIRLSFDKKNWVVHTIVAYGKPGPGFTGGSFVIPNNTSSAYLALDVFQELEHRGAI